MPNWTGYGTHPGATGLLTVAGNAIMTSTGNRRHQAGCAFNATGYITVKDNGQLLINPGTLWMGGYAPNGGGRGFINVQGGVLQVSVALHVGQGVASDTGYGEVNQTGGTMKFGSLYIGSGNSTDFLGRGIVTIVDGLMTVDSSLILGYNPGVNPYPSYGTLNFMDGIITNTGMFVVGSRSGTGEVYQTGGVFEQTGSVSGTYITKIGWNGGVGTFVLSNGTFNASRDVYVGGYAADSTAASTGLLHIAGGVFTVKARDLYVGDFGEGTLKIGPTGALNVRTLTLTNDQATLRFECNAAGVGTCTATGALRLDPDAKLEVDASALRVDGDFVLVNCASRTGSFSPGNILLKGPGVVWIDQDTSEDIVLHRRFAGTTVTVR